MVVAVSSAPIPSGDIKGPKKEGPLISINISITFFMAWSSQQGMT